MAATTTAPQPATAAGSQPPAPPPAAPPADLYRAARPRDSVRSWPLPDRIAYALCWVVGLGLCLAAAAIVLLFAVKGLTYLSPSLIFEHPNTSPNQSTSGGFLDPLEGTVILTAVATLIAAPLGVALAVWLTEYGRPTWLARTTEAAVEMVAGTPDVLLALFAIVIFARPLLAFLSSTSAGGAVSGKSFLTAGLVLGLVALPLVVGATREALTSVPRHMREASFAMGKTKARTIRKVLLPAVRPGIARGITLGAGRIMADTAIVIYVLGGTLGLTSAGGLPILSTLRGEGTTLTNYVYQNSPSGEGGAPQKAYAAAFVLLVFVVALNLIAARFGAGRQGRRTRGERFSAAARLIPSRRGPR
jgi:phosphate transport system permease protein